MNESAATVRRRDAPSPRSATAARRTVPTPNSAIRISKMFRNPASSSLSRAGTTNAGKAPGGYSGRMSRYGTAPFSILLP
jgi:hypothetical protein